MDPYREKLRQYETFILPGIILLGLFARIARCFTYPAIREDAVLYFQMADAWQKGGFHAMDQIYEGLPPFWPAFLGIVQQAGASPEFWAKSLGIILSAAAVPAVYYISMKLTQRKIYAYISSFLFCVHPSFIKISTEMLRDTVYLPLFVFAVASVLYAESEERKWWRYLLFALVVVLGAMFRKEGVELIIIFFLFSLIKVLMKKDTPTAAVKKCAVVLFTFCALSLPLQNYVQKSGYRWSLIPVHLINRQLNQLNKVINGGK